MNNARFLLKPDAELLLVFGLETPKSQINFGTTLRERPKWSEYLKVSVWSSALIMLLWIADET